MSAENTKYQVLYDSVLAKIKDYDLLEMTEEEANGVLFDYIRPSIVRFQSCKKNLSCRKDDVQEFDFTLTDQEIEILASFMVVEYLDANYIRVPSALKQILSSRDFNTFSPANLLAKTKEMRERYYEEAKQLMRDYSYFGSKLFSRLED